MILTNKNSENDNIDSAGKKSNSSLELSDFVSKGVVPLDITPQDIEKVNAAINELTIAKLDFSPEEIDGSNLMRVFLNKLKSEALIKDFDLSAPFSDLDKNIVIKLSQKALDLAIDGDSGDIYYIDNQSNEKCFLNFDLDDDLMHRKSVSLLLDEVPFDILQNGEIRRAKEAEAIYKVITLNKIFGGLYTQSIKEILPTYSFEELKNKGKGGNFIDILKLILEESTSVTRILISACNLKLSEIKTKKDLKLLNSISSAEDRALKSLKIVILNIRNDYAGKIFNEKTKARREVKREEMRAAERKAIEASSVGTIYEILSLNTEAIPLIPKIKIARYAKTVAFQLKESKTITFSDDKILKIANKMQRRGYREFLIEWKEILLKQLRAGEVVEIRPKR